MRSSTQEFPCSDPAWVVASTSAISAELGNVRRTASAPGNGVAPSRWALSSRIGVASEANFWPSIRNGSPAATGHQVQGAENQKPPQAASGASAAIEKPPEGTFA